MGNPNQLQLKDKGIHIMGASGVMNDVRHNDATMANGLDSTQSIKHMDWCCGIHGAARFRKGIKRGTSAARRRHDKEVIQEEIILKEE